MSLEPAVLNGFDGAGLALARWIDGFSGDINPNELRLVLKPGADTVAINNILGDSVQVRMKDAVVSYKLVLEQNGAVLDRAKQGRAAPDQIESALNELAAFATHQPQNERVLVEFEGATSADAFKALIADRRHGGIQIDVTSTLGARTASADPGPRAGATAARMGEWRRSPEPALGTGRLLPPARDRRRSSHR